MTAKQHGPDGPCLVWNHGHGLRTIAGRTGNCDLWPGLNCRFLGDGAIPIDNSLVERQHVRVALTRKNFYFAGSDAGGDRAAVIYTLLGCCALNRVDPEPYLIDVLPRLVRGVTREEARGLLPHRWTPLPRAG
jgi:hypothetical protein